MTIKLGPPFLGMTFGGSQPPPAPGAKRPYRNLDVWPRARAMLAAANEPLASGEIARALGVEAKNVIMALGYHSAEVERIDGKPLRWKLRGAA